MLLFLVAGSIGYLLGSLPTAYLFVKWKSNVDIRKLGSGNVGTLNSYEVTDSKAVGAGVLLIDLVKGLLSVIVVRELVGAEFVLLAAGGVGAVLGHNFPVWLGFKGGRGLATAAGGLLVLSWFILPIWLISWLVGKKISNDINIGNAVATVSVAVLALLGTTEMLARVMPANATVVEFKMFILALSLVILVRLVQPVKEYLGIRKS